MKLLILSFFLVSTAFSFVEVSDSETCAGYPKVTNYQVMVEGKCLGLAFSERDVSWGKPRRLVFKDRSTIYVSDMGGWDSRDSGAVWEVNLETGQGFKIYEGGDWTHGLAIDSKGRLLIGDTNKIIRLEKNGKFIAVIKNLPKEGSHPLSHFILTPDDSIILNVGAPSNDCSESMKTARKITFCPERDRAGEVRYYSYLKRVDHYSRSYVLQAKGLRNSMALIYNERLDKIYQAENNLDAPGIEEEFNEMSLQRGKFFSRFLDFGWPFCYGMGEQYFFPDSRGGPWSFIGRDTYKSFCENKAQAPLFLIPAHSSPLDMMYSRNIKGEAFKDAILMTWHGHRRAEEFALVSYKVKSDGSPLLSDGSLNAYTPILKGVGRKPKHKLRPVGMAEDDLGRLWFVDDVNKAVFILSESRGESGVQQQEEDYSVKVDEFVESLGSEALNSWKAIYADFQSVQTCTSCHSQTEVPNLGAQALKTFLKRGWLDMEGEESVQSMMLLKRMAPDSLRPMPPPPEESFGKKNPEIFNRIYEWVRLNLKK